MMLYLLFRRWFYLFWHQRNISDGGLPETTRKGAKILGRKKSACPVESKRSW